MTRRSGGSLYSGTLGPHQVVHERAARFLVKDIEPEDFLRIELDVGRGPGHVDRRQYQARS
ncbi:hypothetical protein GCM10009677_48230 [Sphaerisporangium rubeum]|uniref:Uncharacterized protein n=1 Tax=Sphaerisporangium rubeum TaxID=321317 RepID=A0A7X0IKF5_9ACTN|nr:hypothetical protein [Sphaerisporangium rubeum]MBB6475317.1 hypothetical protein [Sphaerisporangium rubeum]